LQGVSQNLAREGKAEEQRRFRQPYADRDIPMLWYSARNALGRPIPERYDFTLEFWRWRRDNDLDPEVCKVMDLILRRREIMRRADPETGRLSPENQAELQRLNA
jgi:hypothetical protein